MSLIVSPNNQDFFNYWSSIQHGELIPAKANFLPEEIPKVLPAITVFEMISKEELRFHLIGSWHDTMHGANCLGDNYLDFVGQDRRAKASEAIWHNILQPSAMRVILDFKSKSGVVKRVESIGVPIICTKTGRKFVYFSTFEIDPDISKSKEPEDQLQIINVVERTYIDIGAGVPSFKD